ncbi:MAG: tetratricopeptide repeat protein [Rubripirellula sp.]
MNRREKIEAMLAEDPSDTFLRYSLAMELRSEGDHEKSLKQLDQLMSEDPPCVPAFFMAGQQLADLDRVDEARERLRVGIDQARAQGDAHAAGEMSEFLTSLGDYGEL